MKKILEATLVAAALALVACGSDPIAPGGNDGSIPAEDASEVQSDASVPPDAGEPADSGTDAGLVEDAGGDAGDLEPDGGEPEDAGSEVDAGEPAGALSDYLPCDEDYECPIGYGECVTDVPLNRRDSRGRYSVPVKELEPSLAKNGICTRACTTSEMICEGLSLRDQQGALVPYQCQVVAVGAPVYPSPRPDFPFDSQLVPAELAAGEAFGAICRPPFGLSAAVDDAFCAGCTSTQDCGTGICWSFAESDESTGAPGSCLVPCSESTRCPFGFACQMLVSVEGATHEEHGRYCVPWQSTCSFCRDLDGDLRGLGRCGPADHPVTAYDCNDLDPNAYYDPVNFHHAFPTWCGEHDLNCNGLADSAEQIGPDGFPNEHCTGCYQPCTGTVENGSMGCVLVGGAPACVAQCSEGFADCDGQLATGCEVPVSDPARSYYVDADGDGYGAGDPVFFCSEEEVPATGYASRAGDCNEGEASINPDAADHCDGIDNDCDGSTDEAATEVGGPCDSGEPGVCAAGTLQCVGGSRLCVRSQQPTAESCNGLDDDCNGAVDDDLVGVGPGCTYAALGPCSAGEMRCNASAAAIECTQIVFPTEDLPDPDGIDSNCDGIDGDESIAVFVDWDGSDTSAGTKDAPLRTVSAGLAKAQALRKSHVYIAVGEYIEEANVVLPNGVGLFGGFAPNSWSRAAAEEATHITRAVPATDNEANVSGVDAKDITTATMLQDLSFSIQSPVKPGGSTYGLRCSACTSLKVTRVRFDVAAGANGMTTQSAGIPGDGGVMGAQDRTGGFSFCGTDGGDGGGFFDPGQRGSPASLGGAGGDRAIEGSAGNGGAGSPCTNEAGFGAGGILAPILGFDASGFPRLESSTGGHGAMGCDGGGGGGGGGAWNTHTGGTALGAGGSSGGCGGLLGIGGGSGGSSVGAVLVSSSGILLEKVDLNAGRGGNGGRGVTGGRGGDGVGGTSASGDGGDGGAGANGGGGGGGGGGVGGSAYGIVRDQGTALTGSDLQITYGSAGVGGQGGAGGQGGTYGTAPGVTGDAGMQGQAGERLEEKIL